MCVSRTVRRETRYCGARRVEWILGTWRARPVGTLIPINAKCRSSSLVKELAVTDHVASFLVRLHQVFVKCHFTYLEINPLVVGSNNQCIVLDLAAKLDQTAEFECSQHWNMASILKGLKVGSPPLLPPPLDPVSSPLDVILLQRKHTLPSWIARPVQA